MKEKEIETVFSQAESNDVSLKVLQSMLENVPDNRSKTLNMELIKTMRAASLIGNKEKKWTEPDITNYAVYINGPTFQMDNKTVCLAIDIPFYDLDALGVVTVFVRDANGAPVERGLDNLPDEVKDKLKEPHGLFPSEREGWKDMRYDDRGKWRGKEGKTYYPSDEDLEEIAKQITKLIIALNDCPQYLALFKPKASAEAADKA